MTDIDRIIIGFYGLVLLFAIDYRACLFFIIFSICIILIESERKENEKKEKTHNEEAH